MFAYPSICLAFPFYRLWLSFYKNQELYLSIYLFVYHCLYLYTVYIYYIFISVYDVSICLFVCLSVCRSISLPVYLSICLSIYRSIFPSNPLKTTSVIFFPLPLNSQDRRFIHCTSWEQTLVVISFQTCFSRIIIHHQIQILSPRCFQKNLPILEFSWHFQTINFFLILFLPLVTPFILNPFFGESPLPTFFFERHKTPSLYQCRRCRLNLVRRRGDRTIMVVLISCLFFSFFFAGGGD